MFPHGQSAGSIFLEASWLDEGDRPISVFSADVSSHRVLGDDLVG